MQVLTTASLALLSPQVRRGDGGDRREARTAAAPADALRARDGRGGERLARQHLDQPELDGAVEDLAVGEAGEQVEELPRPAAAHWPKQRKIHGKFLEAGR